MTSSNPYDDPVQAGLYDVQNPWGPSDDYYLRRVMAAESALDIGCGTGVLLVEARRRGHSGELVGVDPAEAMLAVAASKSTDVVWHRASVEELRLGRTFELVTMTGHAFQVLVDDEAIRAALATFRGHLAATGCVVFETRNPAARAWEAWDAAPPSTVTMPDSERVRYDYDVIAVRDDIVEFAENAVWESGATTRSTQSLRFLSLERLSEFMNEAGLAVETVHGDWDGTEVGAASPKIIVTARRGS